MVKRIMRAFKLEEISAVDRPAQPGARALIMKRAPESVRKDMYGVGRFADLLGGLGYLLSSAEDESAYEGDRSPVPAALRAWLKQGLPIFRAMATEEVDEFIAASLAKQADAPATKQEASMISKIFGFAKGFGVSTNALSASVKSIVADDTAANKAALIDETIKQFSDHIETEIEKTLSGGLPGDPSEDDKMSIAMKKALGLAETASEDEVIAAIAKKDADLKVAAEAVSKAADDDRITKALADVEDLKKRNATLEQERDLVKFGKRAVELGLPEAHGEVLMKAHAGDKDALAKLESVIKGLNEQIATGKVFAEFGTTKGGEIDAYAEIAAKAAELRKGNPSMTIEKAKARVIEDPANRELVKRYNDERLSKSHVRAA